MTLYEKSSVNVVRDIVPVASITNDSFVMLAIPAWTPADVSGGVIPFVKLQVERKRD